MRISSSTILLGAALGVSAHPSRHAAHQAAHKRDFVVANKPTTTIIEYVTAAAVAAESSTTAAAVAATSAASSDDDDDDDSSEYVEFCGGSTSKRATLAEIAYKGNTGTDDDYGCNMMVVSSSIADQYEYTATFKNDVAKSQACVCFNKIGPDGGINGFFSGNEAISFTLPASGTKVVAFEANSQGGCVCTVGDTVATTDIGQFAGTWLEFDMANSSNDDWSGADASCLVSSIYPKLEAIIPPLKVCGSGTCSTILSGGDGTNAYLKGMEAADGVGLNLAAGKVRLTITVGEFSA
ncbi:hypothetical protein G7Z17_g9607 [Cylindrodendrum hubeiense]|uniref:Allergen Asp f 4 n=1 Tax=Cylindrodendrum hubeiense TaxID=595255 RepID=A0A9P5L5I6_9HYPO|nr:hypothetical protein G7Z17_g9607 [Cylindrodendrum hubeiense]